MQGRTLLVLVLVLVLAVLLPLPHLANFPQPGSLPP